MNEGFKALPEYVQRKIDPEAAEKFMGGGSVMDRPLFRQMGGPAAPPMMGMAPPQVNPEQVAQVQGMEDLAMGQGEQLGQAYASEMITNIDAADDAKDLIDAFRGNEKPLEARYAELAGYVGEADANRTPESVLAMVQPTIMMTEEGAVDSGIGELMQALVQDVGMAEGEQMSQGVGELMAMGAGNTPPVNFNQGGAVRHYQPGGAVTERATTMLPQFQNLYASVLGDPAQRQAELDEQRRLTQAQMLFDIAQAGLQFAGTTQGNTIAERLANAAAASQVFPRIGERAAGQLAAKQALEKEKRQMDLAALQSSISQAAADKAAADALDLAAAKKKEETIKNIPASIFNKFSDKDQKRIIFGEPNSVNGIPRDLFDELSEKDKKLILGTSTEATEVKGIPMEIFKTLSQEDQNKVIVGDPQGVNGIPRDIFDDLDADAKAQVLGTAKLPVKGVPFEVFETLSADEKKRLIVGDPQGVNGVPRDIFDDLDPDAKKSVLGTGPEDVKGVPRDIFDSLSEDSQERILGISVDIKGVPQEIYDELSDEEQKKLLGIVPVVSDKFITETIETAEGIKFKIINQNTGEEISEENFDPIAKTGGLIKFTIKKDGKISETIATLGSPEGQKLQEQVNAANEAELGSAQMVKVGTESVNPQAYITNEGKVVTSFDNNTYVEDGEIKLLKDAEAKSLGEANVYEIIKAQNIANYAEERLEAQKSSLANTTFIDANGDPLAPELQGQLREFLTITPTDIREGTGAKSNIFAFFNVVGGLIAPEATDKYFEDTTEARKNLGLFNLAAVSALARNPRLAVYDMQKVENVLIQPTAFFNNVASESRKFQSLVQLMTQERDALLEGLRGGDKAITDNVTGALKKLKEIDFVLSLVRIAPSDVISGVGEDAEMFNDLMKKMGKKF